MAKRKSSTPTNDMPGYFDAIAGALMKNHVRENARLAGADLQRAASDEPTGQDDPAWADIGYGSTVISGGTKTVGGTTYNPNYYNNLLAQGHTKDPYTGAPIPGAELKGLTATQMRTVGKAQRDVKALFDLTQGATPQIDMQTAMKAKEAMERKYGAETLIHIPEYRELAGTNEAYQEQKIAAVLARAKETDTDPNMWRFDDDAGKPVLDKEAMDIREMKREEAQVAAKPLVEMHKFSKEMADKRLSANLKIVRESYEQNKDLAPKEAFATYNKELNAAYDAYFKEVGQPPTGQTTSQPTQQQAASAPSTKLTHPKLPAGMSIRGEYSSVPDLSAANLNPGSYAILAGTLVRRSAATGKWEKVN